MGNRHMNNQEVCSKCVLVLSQPSWGVILGRAVPGGVGCPEGLMLS